MKTSCLINHNFGNVKHSYYNLRSSQGRCCASVLPAVAGTVDKPVEFFLARYKNKSLMSSDNKLSSHLAMRALCAPISSASAERIGSRLRTLADFDWMQMGDIAMQRNLYFSGNGIYTYQLVSIASYRADLSEGLEFKRPNLAFKKLECKDTKPRRTQSVDWYIKWVTTINPK